MPRQRRPAPIDLQAEDTNTVMLPSGAMWQVYPREVAYFNERVNKYRKDFALTNVSDLAELDRIIVLETLCHRYMTWESDNADYWGSQVSLREMSDTTKKYSTEIRQLKEQLGIDKVTRDKTVGDDSVAARWADILRRAREFGIMRNQQFDVALELINELMAKITRYHNCTDEERRLMQATKDDIFEWIEEELIPKYQQVDADFRQKQQRMWVEDINRA